MDTNHTEHCPEHRTDTITERVVFCWTCNRYLTQQEIAVRGVRN